MRGLRVDTVSFSYPGSRKNAIAEVSFSAEPGEHIALVGPNGSGKSTLFQILNGTVPPAAGKILLDGKEIRRFSVLERARRIAYIRQGGRISFPYTCFELTLMGLYPSQSFYIPGNAALARAEAVMRETGVWGFASQTVHTLSGGELQRVLLARALLQLFPEAQERQSIPKLLLLDEAFSELDIAARISMMNLLNGLLKERRFTIIGIHHDLHLAYRFTHRIIALQEGRVAGDGSPEVLCTEDFFNRVFGVKAEIIPGKGFLFQDALGNY